MDFTTAAPQHFNGQDKFGATFRGCCASPCFFRWWPEGLSHSWLWSSGNEKNHLQVWKEHIQGLGYSVCADQKHLIKLLSVKVGAVTGWTYTLCLYITHLWIFKRRFQQLINEFLIVFIHFLLLQQLTRAQEKRPLTDLCFSVRSSEFWWFHHRHPGIYWILKLTLLFFMLRLWLFSSHWLNPKLGGTNAQHESTVLNRPVTTAVGCIHPMCASNSRVYIRSRCRSQGRLWHRVPVEAYVGHDWLLQESLISQMSKSDSSAYSRYDSRAGVLQV